MAGVLRRLLRDDRCGAVAVLTAMMGTVLFGFGALALDVGYWEVLRNRAQAAADQAALGAATEIVSGGTQASGQLKKQVKAIAASMGVVDGANGVAITENSPPSQGAYTASGDAVEVIINARSPPATNEGKSRSATAAAGRSTRARRPPPIRTAAGASARWFPATRTRPAAPPFPAAEWSRCRTERRAAST